MPTLTAPNNRQIPWPPAGGVEYIVQKKGSNGESFSDIAAKKNLDVWKLISFNFQTKSPNEVNFILKTNFPTAKRCPDGINYMFGGNEKIYLPPSGVVIGKPKVDLGKIADTLDVEVSDLFRFLNDHGYLNDVLGGSLGLITEALGLDILGALNTLFGNVAGMALFFAYLHRLDQQDEISMSVYAASYQLADWAVKPDAHVYPFSLTTPEFPAAWVQVNFLGIPSNQPVPASLQPRMEQLRAGWERGALQMRTQISQSLQVGYERFVDLLAKKGVQSPREKVSQSAYELLAKLSLLNDLDLLKFSYRDAQGSGVALYFFLRLKEQVSQKCSFPILRNRLPYPSTELNFE